MLDQCLHTDDTGWKKKHLRLTGYLLDLVDHHKGIGKAYFHRVIDRTDLRHLDRDLEKQQQEKNHSGVRGLEIRIRNTVFIPRAILVVNDNKKKAR